MAQIISGKEVSARVKADVAAETAQLRDEKGLKVGLAVVIVGNDPASRVYVNNKKKACEEVGFKSFEYALAESTPEAQLL
ncbi:MAG: bifunctional 5,10-methylene-tetrahydrofolate dehydrogenase/5,10-methylene-tetrahydrofolate cyclohydrolase, partial [Ruminococcus sp.]|nr:bifunctional 5,10-methylene-tetrahydrofolate dehydrogenase/5,10-methylene-tetrahydrofolate cyclohydrolase [Ruminococcus sp.]